MYVHIYNKKRAHEFERELRHGTSCRGRDRGRININTVSVYEILKKVKTFTLKNFFKEINKKVSVRDRSSKFFRAAVQLRCLDP